MRVLVIGGGGREHAILWALAHNSALPLELFCVPGNAGIARIASCISMPISDHAALVDFVRAQKIDLTIVGPEAPLAAGIVDDFQRAGLRIVGPSRAAAQLESSKAFAKDFMRRHGVPTADYVVTNSADDACSILRSGRFGTGDSPVVVKADGLAAGKGVIVARSIKEAEAAVEDLTTGNTVSADAAKQIVIEEALEGKEVSVLLFADGRDYVLMPPARDHKRIGENDTGANTGGMGAITGGSIVDDATLKEIVSTVVKPTLQGAASEGFPFRGVLFVGLMLTKSGPRVLEYNVRFGDPETQAILMRLESSLLEIFEAILASGLGQLDVRWSNQPSACVVLASDGYPGSYQTGFEIAGLDTLSVDETLQVFHAGTAIANGRLVTSGGRVLAVTARSETLPSALAKCYDAIKKINWQGMQYRRDIGRFNESQTAVS
jgi:phosphoribosylamine--glycine ligase